jgi:hypothetical protein
MGYPATAPWVKTAPLKFIRCEEADPKFKSTGEGMKRFYLTNNREDVQFWLFYGGTFFFLISGP